MLLLVEDDEMAASAIEWALMVFGVQVHTLKAGGEVMKTIVEIRPDAVVLDVILEDVDGVMLWREIRRTWPELPVVLTSGRDADFPGVQQAISDRRTAFLSKPFAIETLLEVIARLRAEST
jgi:two-component system, OmpR family, response regulator